MSVGVVEKRKINRTCSDCGETNLPTDVKKCACGSTDIKKSLVIVRKEEGNDSDVLPSEETKGAGSELDEFEDDEDEPDDEESEEEDDDEDEEEEDEEVGNKSVKKAAKRGKTVPPQNADVESADEPDEGEDDDPDDDGDDDSTAAGDTDHDYFTADGKKRKSPLKKRNLQVMGIEALGLTTQLAERVAKIFAGGEGEISKAYEDVMTEFNSVMDAAAERWQSGKTVSKAGSQDRQVALIKDRIEHVVKSVTEGREMPKVTRPEALDGLELPDDVKNYISSLEGAAEVEKKDDIYKGLNPEVVKRLQAADELVEKAEADKWEGIAKSYTHVPGDKKELAKTLRALHTANPTAFEELKKSLDATQAAMKNADIFKQHGASGNGQNDENGIAKRHAAAEELVSKGEAKTVEQAMVMLMDRDKGAHYKPTNVSA